MNVVVKLKSGALRLWTCFRKNVCSLVHYLERYRVGFGNFEPGDPCIFRPQFLGRFDYDVWIFSPVIQIIPMQRKHLEAGSIELRLELLGVANNVWRIKSFDMINAEILNLL